MDWDENERHSLKFSVDLSDADSNNTPDKQTIRGAIEKLMGSLKSSGAENAV